MSEVVLFKPTDQEKITFSEAAINYIEDNHLDYISGLASFSEISGVDYDEISMLISNKLYVLVQKEAIESNMINDNGIF